jgi:hypothetical protein
LFVAVLSVEPLEEAFEGFFVEFVAADMNVRCEYGVYWFGGSARWFLAAFGKDYVFDEEESASSFLDRDAYDLVGEEHLGFSVNLVWSLGGYKHSR